MTTRCCIRLILGDQLSESISSLTDIDTAHDVVCMFEVRDETEYVEHHKQKIVLLLSAMRHFADSLRARNIPVDYVSLLDRKNTGSFTGELHRAVKRHRAGRVIVTEPGEWRVWNMMQGWQDELGIPVEIRQDLRFFCSRREFGTWASGRKSLRMEFFYREMRRKTGYLMENGSPAGGKWNFDAENRKPLTDSVPHVKQPRFRPDPETREVISLVNNRYARHFGNTDSFSWPVTRKDALKSLHHFVRHNLPSFGDFQDAMKDDDTYLFHSLISPSLNRGLLTPKEVCDAVVAAFERGLVPLNATEGFIRQIIGWREFIRGVYWTRMPAYGDGNFLRAHNPLPSFYWDGETDMRCIRQTVKSAADNAYAHHIQRLMITGNFALLAGAQPPEVQRWYLIVFADAYEWVELPNTHGMALFADGGVLSSKPYAASGAYINRMSDYCRHCRYDPARKTGESACPFNVLYWHFIHRNTDKLGSNPRMAFAYRALKTMKPDELRKRLRQAEAFLSSLRSAYA